MTEQTMPAVTTGERLRYALVPPRLYAHFRGWRGRLKGEPELRLLPYLVDRRRASVDVGANKGVYTYWLARLCPRAYALEPNPKMLDILRREASANVTVMPYAASDSAGPATFRIPRWSKGYSNQAGSLGWQDFDGETLELTVECRRLDDEGLDPVGFMKIDVEGHELAVLRGARGVLERDRPNLLVEIEDQHLRHAGGGDIGDTFDFLRDMNYSAHVLIEGGFRVAEAAAIRDGQLRFIETREGPYINNVIFLPSGS